MRYLPLSNADRSEMLQTVGAATVDDLFKDVPPDPVAVAAARQSPTGCSPPRLTSGGSANAAARVNRIRG